MDARRARLRNHGFGSSRRRPRGRGAEQGSREMSEQKFTPGPWVVRETVVGGKRYGGCWVEALDPEDERGERLIKISGSGGARSYTTRVVDIQMHDDNDANAHLISAAPEMLSALER